MGCWCSALAFVRNCGVGPPYGFAFPVALHPYIRPVCAYQFSYAAPGIMVSSFEWFGLLPRLYYCRVAIRHQCLVVTRQGFTMHANKGFIRDNKSARAETQRSFFEEKVSFGITRLYQNVQPSDQGRQGYRLSYDGIGFVKVSEALFKFR
jgi:hypothetical protein